MIINTLGDCVPEERGTNKKKEGEDLNIFFSPSVRPLNGMADASRRSSSSGKYSFIFFLRVFRARIFIEKMKNFFTLYSFL
jgi:hypothetical protein